MGVNSLPNTVTRPRRDCELNPGPSAPESSALTIRLLSHPNKIICYLSMHVVYHLKRIMLVFDKGVFWSSLGACSPKTA